MELKSYHTNVEWRNEENTRIEWITKEEKKEPIKLYMSINFHPVLFDRLFLLHILKWKWRENERERESKMRFIPKVIPKLESIYWIVVISVEIFQYGQWNQWNALNAGNK